MFPAIPLDVEIDLNLAGTWTPVTSYAVQDSGTAAAISWGRQDETSQASPSSCSMRWNNRDGRFTRLNPTGPYYGQLGKNTPVRVSVPAQNTVLRLEDDSQSWAYCADSSGLQITGSIDVRVDMAPSGYGSAILAAKWGTTATCWAFTMNADGSLTFAWYDGTTVHQATSSGLALPIPLGRCMVRATLNTATGTVQFYTAATMGGSETLLATVTGAGATSIAAGAGQPVRVGYSATYAASYGCAGLTGSVYEARVYSGIAGTLEADPQFTAQPGGTTSFSDGQSNLWKLAGTAAISARLYRFHGEAAQLPQEWDTSGTDVWTPVTASGVLRRLNQGNAPLPSAMRRGILQQPGLQAYWPCEDGQAATQLASGLPGRPPMAVSGGAGFAADSVFTCSNPVPTVGASTWTGQVPAYASTGSIAVRFLLDVESALISSGVVALLTVETNGALGHVDVAYIGTGVDNPPVIEIVGYGGYNFANTSPGQYWVSLELVNSGGNTNLALYLLPAGSSSPVTAVTATVTGATAGAATNVFLNRTTSTGVQSGNWGSSGAGHVYVASQVVPLATLAPLLGAHAGETAGSRFARLCSENGISPRVYGFPADTVAMGVQAPQTLMSLLQECETADNGLIYDSRQSYGLTYRTAASMMQQSPAVALDYGQQQVSPPLEPTDDDQHTRNDVIAQRTAGTGQGGTYQATLNDGSPMSISAPPAGAGDYQTQVSVNVASDSQLPDAAGWLVHAGTDPGQRFPVVNADLAATTAIYPASLFWQVLAATTGDYLQILNPPAWLPPGPVKQLVYGGSEQLGVKTLRVAWNCVPEAPWEAGILDDPVYGHADTDGSTLAAAITAAATSMQVATTNPASPLWTTSAADLPFDVAMGGEQVTVTGITGPVNIGAFLSPAAMQQANYASAVSAWDSWTGDTLRASRIYYGLSSFPVSDSTLAYDAANGIKCCINLCPAYNPVSATDLANLTAMLAYWQGQGLTAEVSLWAEPYNNGLTAGQYIAMVNYYGPAVRAYYPLVFCTSALSVQNNNENSYYPGDSAVDKIATDLYAIRWLSGTTLDQAASIADSAVPPKPFGLWEFNSSVAGSNFLTGDNTSFEGSAGTWTGAGNATVARSTAQAHTGTASLAMTASAAGNMNAASCAAANITTQGMPCSPGDSVTCSAWMLAATTTRSVQVGANWYNSSGTLLSSSFGTAVSDSTSAWTQVTATVTAPASAAYCRLNTGVLSAGASEVHYVDDGSIGDLSTGQTQAQATSFFAYLQSFFATRLAAGKQNADMILFNSGSASNAIVSPVISAADYRVALFQGLYAALNGTSSPQAFTIIRSVNGVVKAQAAGTDIRLAHPAIAVMV